MRQQLLVIDKPNTLKAAEGRTGCANLILNLQTERCSEVRRKATKGRKEKGI